LLGTFNFFDKIAITNYGVSYWQACLISVVFALLSIIVLNSLFGPEFKLTDNKIGEIYLIFSGILYALAIYILYYSLQHLDVGTTISIYSSSAIIFGLFLSVIFLNEQLNYVKISGIICCIVGIILIQNNS